MVATNVTGWPAHKVSPGVAWIVTAAAAGFTVVTVVVIQPVLEV